MSDADTLTVWSRQQTPADPRPTAEEVAKKIRESYAPFDPSSGLSCGCTVAELFAMLDAHDSIKAHATALGLETRTQATEAVALRLELEACKRAGEETGRKLAAAQMLVGRRFIDSLDDIIDASEVVRMDAEIVTARHDLAVANAAVAELRAEVERLRGTPETPPDLRTGDIVKHEGSLASGTVMSTPTRSCFHQPWRVQVQYADILDSDRCDELRLLRRESTSTMPPARDNCRRNPSCDMRDGHPGKCMGMLYDDALDAPSPTPPVKPGDGGTK